jgi:hypothetical protein
MKTRMKHPGNIFGAFQEMERSWKHFPVTVRQVSAFLIKLFKKKKWACEHKTKKTAEAQKHIRKCRKLK